MKDTLERQLEVLHKKREEEGKTNPEQANYSFISNIFRDKKPAYDKKQYSMFLDKQHEEQRMNKMSEKYMNEEEYRLNSNQLNVHHCLFRKPSRETTPTTDIMTVR